MPAGPHGTTKSDTSGVAKLRRKNHDLVIQWDRFFKDTAPFDGSTAWLPKELADVHWSMGGYDLRQQSIHLSQVTSENLKEKAWDILHSTAKSQECSLTPVLPPMGNRRGAECQRVVLGKGALARQCRLCRVLKRRRSSKPAGSSAECAVSK